MTPAASATAPIVVRPAAAAPMLALLAYDQHTRARRGAATLIEPGLFRLRSFSSGLAVSLLVEAVLGGLTLTTTFLLQDGLGLSAAATGLITLVMVAGMVLGAAVLTEALIPRIGRHVVTIGGVTLGVGLLALAWPVHRDGTACAVWALLPGLAVAGVGLGMLMGPLFAITLQDVGTAHAGTASGTLEAVEQLGSVLGVAIVGTVFFRHTHAGTAGAFEWGMAAALAVLAAALVLVPLLPRRFRTEEELDLG